ncbi:ABC transporter substrate-binding protein [Cohnella sp. 56]|uniref:ABC transporter substrate-binding protein n=1 Tax=Cohnella sp. 56 TaxID=3113722 RepID=UPI0030EAE64F
MNKSFKLLMMVCVVLLSLGAMSSASAAPAKRQITYNGKTYSVPAKTDKIVVVGALESLEDALVLNYSPLGASTVGGKFQVLYAKITAKTVGIGEKTEPSLEKILKLKPDVILSSTKFPAATNAKLAKIAVTIPVSHISTDWQRNLYLLADLTGKTKEVKAILDQYQKDVKTAQAKVGPKFKGKTAVALRVRSGNLFVYPQDVFFNPSLYKELGATAPGEVLKAKAQQNISLEQFSDINPDYIFLQFSADENKDNPKALDELKANPIWTSLKAVKNGNVYVNLVDPLSQGGTAYSKISFLEALKKTNLWK